MEEERQYKSAEELGAWVTDTEFEFFMPVVLGPGMIAKRVDVSHFMTLDPDIQVNEIVEALGNQVGGADPVEVSADQLVRVSCPDCGGQGALPRELLPPDYEGDFLVRCPRCRNAARN